MLVAFLAAALVSVAPPPAFVDTATTTVRLAQSSYCWRGEGSALCADYVRPSCVGPGAAPRVHIRRGERVRLRLGFDPTRLTVELPRARRLTLAPKRTTTFRIVRSGVLVVFAVGARGDTSYAACLVVR